MLKSLIALKDPKSRAAEAYRTLRTNIQFSSLDKEIKTIVVTSSQPSEGKSTIIANLAITFAQSGKKVILLDCDFRRPTLHKNFQVENLFGITSILAQEINKDDCIKTLDIPNLFLLTSGPIPPNPAELLGTKKMRSFINEIRESYDIILMDAPPVLAVTDAQILSTFSDGVIFITSFGQSEKYAIVKGKESIEKVGGHIIGVVLNKVPDEKSYAYGKYSYYNYSYR